MTKRRILCLLCVAFCLILAACGEDGKPAGTTPSESVQTNAQPSQTASEKPAQTPEAKPAAFEAADVETVLAAEVFSEELEAVDAELVYGLYGLSADQVAECTAYLSTGASAEEIVLFTMADEAGVKAVEDACAWRIEDQTFGYKSYKPAEVPKLENAIVEVRGTTVLFVVANDWEKAEQIVAGLN